MKPAAAKSLHRTRHALAGFLLSLLVLGILAAPTKKHEVFPFFCWFLFSQTPGIEDNYELIIIAHNGQTLDHPQSFMTSPLVDGKGQESSTNAHRIIEALGKAIIANDQAAITTQRAMIEGNYFNQPVSYQIKKKIYDPIQYRRTGKAEESVIATFHPERSAKTVY